MRRWRRWLVRTLALLVLAVGGVAIAVGVSVRSSLPRLDGELTAPGLDGVVSIERDARGVVDVVASTRTDAAFALGFLHAQDRFFAMDLSRRAAAGTLSELFGAIAINRDRELRLHRFGAVAREVVDALAPRHRAILDAYTSGVNSGLAALRARPFEYWLLRQKPRAWEPDDSVLVLLAMFLDLQDREAGLDTARGLLAELASPALARFLLPQGDGWEAPLVGAPGVGAPIPGPADLVVGPPSSPIEAPADAAGSNAFAVAGAHTRSGAALVANDMHLGLRVPNIWYRAQIAWNEAGRRHQVVGATLPGTPALVVGSNGFVAWGFTNSYGDWLDLVELETDGNRYRTPDGWREFTVHRESIAVRGAAADSVVFRTTRWGPVVAGPQGGLRALRWVAQEADGVGLELLELERVRDVDEALDLAGVCGLPGVNLVVGDRGGRIGWTVMGRVPRRVGFDGSVPVSMADGERRWDGWVAPAELPRVTDPGQGRLWSANGRHVPWTQLASLGDGGFSLGARGQQIRDDLLALSSAHEADLLAIQLDDRALFLQRWHDLLHALLVAHPDAPLQSRLADWDGRASTGSVAYRFVRAFRLEVHDAVLRHLTAGLVAQVASFPVSELPRPETPVWSAVQSRAPHLLPAGHNDWDGFLLSCARRAADTTAGGTWGQRNTLAIRHPLSGAVPWLSGWLDLPADAVAGDAFLPRVQGPAFGASQRMVVSPGHEESGIFHMPGGQSGHPLSPFYRAGHRDWVEGRPSALLPGPPQHRLELRPAG